MKKILDRNLFLIYSNSEDKLKIEIRGIS
jgi:hypothetical protein